MTRTADALSMTCTACTPQVAHRTRIAGGGPSGGDFTVLVRLPAGGLGIGIGDVAGHGGRVAAVAGQLRSAMRAAAGAGAQPAAVLARLNRLLLALCRDSIATATYAVVHPGPGTLVHASAGHLPLLCAHVAGTWTVEAPVGLPLGVCGGVEYEEHIAAIPAGGTLLAYTDGLVERRGEDIDVGLRRFQRAAHATSDQGLREQVDEVFTGLTTGCSDDATLVGLRHAAADEASCSAPWRSQRARPWTCLFRDV